MRTLETADLEMDEHYLPKMVKTMSEPSYGKYKFLCAADSPCGRKACPLEGSLNEIPR